MNPNFLAVGSAAGFLGVALGAFGAHALKKHLEPRLFEVFQTAVTYQFLHALALLAVGLLLLRGENGMLRTAGWAFTTGIVIFSGSLYALALSGVGMWGAVTPIGGVAFLVGWATLFWAVLR